MTQTGTGNFVWGYFGGLTDAVTGLIYVGGGQYYDPKTGRFLTRVVPFNPLRPRNPYVPTNDPLGALLGPMVLLVFLARRRKKNGKIDRVLLLLVVLAAMSLGVAACQPPSPTPVPPLPTGPSNPPPTVPPEQTTTPAPPPTTPTPTPTPTPSPSPTQPPTQTPTPCPTPNPKDIEILPTDYQGLGKVTIVETTVSAYKAVRRELQFDQLEADGRIKDEWLLAIIIYGEFGQVSGNAFFEALEAVSFEYHASAIPGGYARGCGGSCDTIREQLNWLIDVESFRDFGNSNPQGLVTGAQRMYNYALQAKDGYASGTNDSTIWGNYDVGSPLDLYAQGIGSAYWWTQAGEPFTGIDRSQRFVVFNYASNSACYSIQPWCNVGNPGQPWRTKYDMEHPSSSTPAPR